MLPDNFVSTFLADFSLAEIRFWLLTIVCLLLVVALVVVLYKAAKSTQDDFIPKLRPSFFFWLGIAYLGILLAVAGFYQVSLDSKNLFEDELIGGMLPVAVPWFGAMGAVMISLQGVFCFNDKWEAKYNYWHIARPVFGAVLGIVAFYFFVLITMAAGTKPQFLTPSNNQEDRSELIIYYVLAFLVGYREETFRELITRVTDLIFKPSGTAPASPAVTFKVDGKSQPAMIDFGNVKQNTESTKTVEIENSGNVAITQSIVTVSSTVQNVFVGKKEDMEAKIDLAPGAKRTVLVTFKPTENNLFTGTIEVTGANLSPARSIRLQGTGTV